LVFLYGYNREAVVVIIGSCKRASLETS